MIDNRFLFISFLIFVILGLVLGSAKARGDDLSNLNAIVDEVAKPYDLAKTIKTLIYIESRNGLYPINLNDPSCGVTHININTYMKRHKIKKLTNKNLLSIIDFLSPFFEIFTIFGSFRPIYQIRQSLVKRIALIFML